MAAVWFTEVLNATDNDFTLDFTDPTWRPVANGRRYQVGEPVSVSKAHGRIFLPSPWPGIPTIDIPPGPFLIDMKYAFIGWADFASTRLAGPKGFVDFVVGPTNTTENMDYLRVLDEVQADVVEPLPVGPRGGGWIASTDLHLVITNDGVRPIMWSTTGVGASVLARFDQLATEAMTELIKKLVDGIPIKF